mmetsp:Transcript_61254/g.145835  ORF Transcript_61254/g.145835 Transcript_61254/m.145835 type:complete len:389 (-) Transcript_61254:74-1240(-)
MPADVCAAAPVPLGIKCGHPNYYTLTARMQRDQTAFMLARKYEGVLARMEMAMDRSDHAEVQKMRGELMACLHTIQDARCHVQVDQLLQRGRYHVDARSQLQTRFQQEFSLLGLRGGGGAMSSCMKPEPATDDPYATRRPLQQPQSGSALQAQGGPSSVAPAAQGDAGDFPDGSTGIGSALFGGQEALSDRLARAREVIKEAEEPDDWGPVPSGPKGWLLRVKRFLDLPEVGVTLIVANTVSFTLAPLVDLYDRLGGEHIYNVWTQAVQKFTISTLLIGLLLDIGFHRDGGLTYLSNEANAIDFALIVASFVVQVILPAIVSTWVMFVINLPILLWRIYLFVRRLQEWCFENRDDIKKQAEAAGLPQSAVEAGFHYGGVDAAGRRYNY